MTGLFKVEENRDFGHSLAILRINSVCVFVCVCVCVCKSLQSLCACVLNCYPTLCNPRDRSPPGSFIHGVSPGKNTGLGCCALLQGNFLTQESNQHLLSLLP